MKLIDHIYEKYGDEKQFILECSCPSSYGPEYDRYDLNCAVYDCKDCWNQEMEGGG